jgi:pimeloyl-ACP methyl ester carboxylesterase
MTVPAVTTRSEIALRTAAVGPVTEAGGRENPSLLLLHGFTSSSQMFRDLIPLLTSWHRTCRDSASRRRPSAALSPTRLTTWTK